MSFRTPLQLAIAEYMEGYYSWLSVDTQSLKEYVARGFATSVVWVPGRMVDQVEMMIQAWKKNDNTGKPGLSSMLPVILVGLAKDFSPATADVGSATPMIDFAFPEDPEARNYKVAASINDYRAQIVILAPEIESAHSLIMQFHLWANQGPVGRRFKSKYEFAGFPSEWPVFLESIDIGAMNQVVGDQKNLTVLVADLNVRATIPVFFAPGDTEVNDGKSAPAGYPVVVEFRGLGTSSGATTKTTVDNDGNIVTEST